jgi:hypothetical protein
MRKLPILLRVDKTDLEQWSKAAAQLGLSLSEQNIPTKTLTALLAMEELLTGAPGQTVQRKTCQGIQTFLWLDQALLCPESACITNSAANFVTNAIPSSDCR